MSTDSYLYSDLAYLTEGQFSPDSTMNPYDAFEINVLNRILAWNEKNNVLMYERAPPVQTQTLSPEIDY